MEIRAAIKAGKIIKDKKNLPLERIRVNDEAMMGEETVKNAEDATMDHPQDGIEMKRLSNHEVGDGPVPMLRTEEDNQTVQLREEEVDDTMTTIMAIAIDKKAEAKGIVETEVVGQVAEKTFGATAVVAVVKEAAEAVEMTIVVQIEAETVIIDLVVVVAAVAVEAVDDGVRGTRISISLFDTQ